jgi:hypothetical protein
MIRPGIRIVPSPAHSGITQEYDAMASMRGIDCGRKTGLFCKTGDDELSDPRNNILEQLIGVAGRLRAFEHHIGPLWLET